MFKIKSMTMMAVLVIAMMFSGVALAKGPSSLKMGTGGETGNYYAMGNDIYSYCNEVIDPETTFEVLTSGASVANIEGMLSKTYSAGITQEDVLQYKAKLDPRKVNMNRMKIIADMHMETFQLLIPIGYKPKTAKAKELSMWEKAKMKVGLSKEKKTAPMIKISLNMLNNQEVAAWGGSAVSAKALAYFMGIKFKVVNVPEDQRASIVMPILRVGGIPDKVVADYLATGKFNLVSIDYDAIRNKAQFYLSTQASYTIGGTTHSAETIGVRALLLGKSFRKESRNANMIALSQCISDSIADLADDPDTNPNWQSAYDLSENGSQTNWAYFPVK